MSQLTSLVLTSCPRVTDRGLLALGRAAALRHLAVESCPQLSAAALAVLRRRLPLLRLDRPRGRAAAHPILEY